MFSIVESKNSTVLVASFQQLVDTIIQNNSYFIFPNPTQSSSGSVSPSSSIDSSNYSSIESSSINSYDKIGSSQVTKKKLERPSDKIQIDVSKYMEKSARILNKNPNKIIMCSFCKNNREPEHIYQSHSIKDIRGRVTCPLLKEYVCPSCGESGENAHTITYCKKLKAQKRSDMISKHYKN